MRIPVAAILGPWESSSGGATWCRRNVHGRPVGNVFRSATVNVGCWFASAPDPETPPSPVFGPVSRHYPAADEADAKRIADEKFRAAGYFLLPATLDDLRAAGFVLENA
jgi:hypothetical protein